MVPELHASVDMRLFLTLVLERGRDIEVLGAEEYELVVFLKKLGTVKVEATVVALLVEIHGTDLQLDVFEVGRDIDDEIIRAHITKQTDEAPFIKLHQLLGDSHRFESFAVEPFVDEYVAGNSHNMFFSQCVMKGEVVHSVW